MRVSAIGINDDLPAGESRVALRSTDNESSRRIDEVLGFLVQKLFADNRLDDIFHQIFFDLFHFHVRIVLC